MRAFLYIAFVLGLFVLISCKNEPKEVVKSYHFNGKPMVVDYIDEDSNVVKTVEYYKNGQKKMEGTLKNGVRNGEWSYWYDNGKLWSRGSFVNGKSEGRFLSYNEKGMLFQESFYKNGVPDGKWAFYKDDQRIKEVYYENGNILNEVDL
jgi:antitoxin component YwqK of YwqJK toxin-antitoxin module